MNFLVFIDDITGVYFRCMDSETEYIYFHTPNSISAISLECEYIYISAFVWQIKFVQILNIT